MKFIVILINVGCGGIVNYNDFIVVLQNGVIKVVVLDVIELVIFLRDYLLLNMLNVIFSLYIVIYIVSVRVKLNFIVFEQLKVGISGKELFYLVN